MAVFPGSPTRNLSGTGGTLVNSLRERHDTMAELKTDQPMTNEDIQALRNAHFIPTATHYYTEALQLVRAQGCYVYDETDKEYLDCIGGIVCLSVGHNHPKIKSRIRKMLDRDEPQHTSLLYLNPNPAKLAEKLTSQTPEKLNRVAFTNSGSEANELAFMAARHATGESFILSLRHGYHGGTSAALASCGHGNWRFQSQPVTAVTTAEAPYCYRCPFGQKKGSCALECAQHVEQTIQTTTHGKIAAMIVEPVMGVGGFIDPPKEYFETVVDIVHRYGGQYISDEVQTGAGRCGGEFLLTKELGIDADIITMAKGFGNGAAIGAVVMKDEIANPLAGRLYFNTFGGDPYQTMQALSTMEIIEEENLIKNAHDMGNYLREGLESLKTRHELIGDVRGRGLLLGLELVKNRQTKEHASKECNQLMEETRKRGLLIGKGGLFGNVVRLAPPLSITRAQVDFVIHVLDESLSIIK